MIEQEKPQAVKGNHIPRAGKKHSYTAPQPLNPEKKRLKEMGEKQFYTKEQLTVPATKLVFDKKIGKIVVRAYDAPVQFLWDENRKHFVYSPPSKELDYDN